MQLLNRGRNFSQTENLNQRAKRSSDHILVFDLATTGHHPVYIKHLVQHWYEKQLRGTLQVVVSPAFLQQHADIAALSLATPESRVEFIAISADEVERLKSQSSYMGQAFAQWNLFCHYAEELKANQGLLMHFDGFQIPLLVGQEAPCPVAGIYFRPTFHYSDFIGYQPTMTDKLRQWRQQLLLSLILKRSQLSHLFCLDVFAVKHIEKFAAHVKVLPLADPVELHHCDPALISPLRQTLGIEPQRKVLLLFGELSSRKGIYQIFEALRTLPNEVAEQSCLLLAGPIYTSERAVIEAQIEQLRRTQMTQLVVCDRYIKGQEVRQFFELADVILATYQRHVGMSSILLHAAAAQKPVISSNYGLMGELVRYYQLGLAVNSEDATAIAQAICKVKNDSISADLNRMSQFVEQNLVDRFVRTITSELLHQSSAVV